MNIDKIIEEAINNKASDIHLTFNLPPIIRVDGKLQELKGDNFKICNDEYLESFLLDLTDSRQRKIFEKEKNLDLSKSFADRRLRIHIYTQMDSIAFAIRIIPMQIPELKDLKLPASIKKCIEMKEGLVLVTGVTGSGKSTTLAALINEINKTQNRHIITVEDPIEYIHSHNKSMVNQREVGSDVLDFADAVKAAMREDPDILLLGELRDLDTIQNAITMAETGHLVFGTLHTKSVAETADRMIDVFPGDKQEQIRVQLANSLRLVVSQELLPKKGGGRIASCEVMFVNDAIRNLIKKQGSVNEIIDTMNANSKNNGSQTKLQSLAMLLKAGFIDYKTAFRGLNQTEIDTIHRLVGF